MAGASKQGEGNMDTNQERKIGGTSLSSILGSAVKKVSAVGAVYLAGYFQISVAWLIGPIILLVIRDQWRKEKLTKTSLAQAAALANEKDVVLARINDLPAWVFFPDVERVEWLNKIVKQVWPNVNHYAKEMIRDKIQPSLAKNLEKYKLNGFKFERMILGSVPPRIGGIKVYDKNIGRNEIIMDLDLSYAGDCDINFYLSGMKGGIKDFQLDGMLRVVMKPLISTIPIVGGLQVFFLNNPSVDFNLVGVADILDMPGLSDMLRRIVVETIASMMVLPNKFPITLSDIVEPCELKIPEPEGVLRIHVIEAKHLMKKDYTMLGKGKSDPYAVITVGAQEFRTKVISNSVDPKWDFWCETIILEPEGQQVYLHVLDCDDTSDDENLGRATVEVANIAKKGEDDMWVTLEQAKHGMVHLRMTWLKLSKDYNDLKQAVAETQMLRVTDMSTAILTVYVDSAKNLPQARSTSKPDPYVVFTVGRNSQQTAVQMRTSDPVWEQGFTFLVPNPESDTLYLKVIDQKTTSELGQLTLNLSALGQKPNLRYDKQPFALIKTGELESKIILTIFMRILKCEKSEPVQESLSRTPSVNSSGSNDQQRPELIREPSTASSQGQIGSLLEQKSGIEELIEDSSVPALTSTPPRHSNENLIHRVPSVTSSSGEAGLGRIELTLRYSVQRQKLIVVIHKICNIPLKDPSNIPDPYVKLYLLPDRAKDTKRKTHTVKDNCNPIFDESFEYLISQGELNSQQLEVTVCTQKQLFSGGNNLGHVVIDLSKYNITQPYSGWFDLMAWKGD